MIKRLFLILVLIAFFFIVALYFVKHKKIFFGVCVQKTYLTSQDFDKIQDETGLIPSLIHFQVPFHKEFPLSSLETIHKYGAVAILSWNISEMGLVDEILQGAYDPYVKNFAKKAKSLSLPFILNIAPNMNKWAASDPEKYKTLFRYIVDTFKEQQIGNVLFAFCPNVDNRAEEFYPGNDVDIFGMQGYAPNKNDDFEKLFSPLYHTLRKLNGHIPIFVFGTASLENTERWLEKAIHMGLEWNLSGLIWCQKDGISLFANELRCQKTFFAPTFTATTWLEKQIADRNANYMYTLTKN